MNKQILLTKKQELEKQKLLLQLEKDIQNLQNDIHNCFTKNKKINKLKRIKYILLFIRFILPYVIAASISFEILNFFKINPFILDERKIYLEIMKEIDSFGNIRYEEQYDSFDSVGKISYFGKWHQEENNFYSREIKTYVPKNIEEDKLNKIINNKDITSLEEILGKPEVKKETKNNLTEEEINSEPFLQAVIYGTVDDDYIIVKETSVDNTPEIILYFLVVLLCIACITTLRKFNYKDRLEDIKEKYPLIDLDELKKKLEIRYANYDRLVR